MGESSYQLNGRVPFEDVLNLFGFEGIGDNAFSMISQGRVESIFNSKPEERRFIVEELIGVSKYRLGKEKAKRELDQTAGYLDRVNDLMTETIVDWTGAAKQFSQGIRHAKKAVRYIRPNQTGVRNWNVTKSVKRSAERLKKSKRVLLIRKSS